MNLKEFKQLTEAKDQKDNRLFKLCSFEWILDLLKDGVVNSYAEDDAVEIENQVNWIALTTDRNSSFNQRLPEYGTCEVTFDKELLRFNNNLYTVKFIPEWLDLRPSVCLFLTKGKYSDSKSYFRENYKNVDWTNADNFSRKFFNPYIQNEELMVEEILSTYNVGDIEDYIYDSKYMSFDKFLHTLGSADELILTDSPLRLVNDAITQIIIPRRYKEKITEYEREYKIRYE